MKKKLAGLLTFHASHNMGSILQTFAMKNILEERYFIDAEIINFSAVGQKDLYSLYSKQGGIKGGVKNVLIRVMSDLFESRHNDFSQSIDEIFVDKTRSIINSDDLSVLSVKYDYLVTGSDQIWNLSCSDFDDIYFLPFKSSAKKISYAPSFGGKNILKNYDSLYKYKKYILDYDQVSARERNGVKWIKEMTGLDVPLVADPTLVANKDIFDSLAKKSITELPDRYIFFYGIPFDKSVYGVLKSLSKKYNLPVVMVDVKPFIFGANFLRGFKLSKHSRPADYLNLIKNSEFVITTSFHGSIFSNLLKKPFWYLTFRGTNPEDDRLDTLLCEMNLMDRKVLTSDFSEIDFLAPIDFNKVTSSLQPLVNRSKSFLDRAFCSGVL